MAQIAVPRSRVPRSRSLMRRAHSTPSHDELESVASPFNCEQIVSPCTQSVPRSFLIVTTNSSRKWSTCNNRNKQPHRTNRVPLFLAPTPEPVDGYIVRQCNNDSFFVVKSEVVRNNVVFVSLNLLSRNSIKARRNEHMRNSDKRHPRLWSLQDHARTSRLKIFSTIDNCLPDMFQVCPVWHGGNSMWLWTAQYSQQYCAPGFCPRWNVLEWSLFPSSCAS